MFNSEDFRVLQEAYASVYESSHLETDTKKRHKDNDEAIEDMKKTKGYKDMAATAKKKMEEEVFDAILSHLISEGYADDATSAAAIMAHMSEEWRESIVEADSIAAMRERAAKRRKQRYGDERFGRDDFKSNAQKKKEADARMQAYLDSKAAEKG